MHQIKRLSAAALLALPLAHAPQALAAPLATFSASLTNITIQVIDLDKSDGVAAGYTFVNPTGGDATTWWLGQLLGPYASSGYQQPFASFNESMNNASTSQQATGTANSLSLSGSVLDRSGIYNGGIVVNLGSQDLNATDASYLLLAPNTQLRITAQAQTQVTSDLSCTDCAKDSANLSASAYIDTWAPLTNREQMSVNSSRWVYGSNPIDSDADSGLLVANLVNDGSTAARRGLQIVVAGGGTYFPVGTPTPEPGTYALVGLGLGAAGWWARRRKTAQ